MILKVKDTEEAIAIGTEALRLLLNVHYYAGQWRDKGGSVNKMNLDYWRNKTEVFLKERGIEKNISNKQDKINFENINQ